MSKPTNEWYCKDLRNTVINRQKREINKLKKENEKMKNKIKEEIQILMSNKIYNDDLSIDYTHNDLMDSAIAALEELLEEDE